MLRIVAARIEPTGPPMESNWNTIADADLRAMLAAGWTIDTIAFALDRPKEAIEARKKELGLDSTPLKPKGRLFPFSTRQSLPPLGKR